jgi:hypothetical protein
MVLDVWLTAQIAGSRWRQRYGAVLNRSPLQGIDLVIVGDDLGGESTLPPTR